MVRQKIALLGQRPGQREAGRARCFGSDRCARLDTATALELEQVALEEI
jgi:hypothetical protein